MTEVDELRELIEEYKDDPDMIRFLERKIDRALWRDENIRVISGMAVPELLAKVKEVEGMPFSSRRGDIPNVEDGLEILGALVGELAEIVKEQH